MKPDSIAPVRLGARWPGHVSTREGEQWYVNVLTSSSLEIYPESASSSVYSVRIMSAPHCLQIFSICQYYTSYYIALVCSISPFYSLVPNLWPSGHMQPFGIYCAAIMGQTVVCVFLTECLLTLVKKKYSLDWFHLFIWFGLFVFHYLTFFCAIHLISIHIFKIQLVQRIIKL